MWTPHSRPGREDSGHPHLEYGGTCPQLWDFSRSPFPSCSIEEQVLYIPEHRATVPSAVTCWAGGSQ